MRLSDFLRRGQLLEIRCGDCRAKTLIDPSFFLARRGDITAAELRRRLVCGGCVSGDIELVALVPPKMVDAPLRGAVKSNRSTDQAQFGVGLPSLSSY